MPNLQDNFQRTLADFVRTQVLQDMFRITFQVRNVYNEASLEKDHCLELGNYSD